MARDLASALRGFEPLPQAALGAPLRADTAVIVFERARRARNAWAEGLPIRTAE